MSDSKVFHFVPAGRVERFARRRGRASSYTWHPGNWPFLAIDDTPVLVGFSRPGAAPSEAPIELLVTDPEVGLTDADVEEAIRRLRKMAGEEPP